jgi:hypothetical protein
VRRLLVVAILAASFAAPSTDAAIVPGRSIAGVELGLTRAEVRAALGAPIRVRRASNEFGPFTVFHYFRLRVTFQGNAGATAVETTRRRQRTARGIGVGSTTSQVLARVAGSRCERTLCTKGRLTPGGRVTVFRLRRGRVTSVLVGFVID